MLDRMWKAINEGSYTEFIIIAVIMIVGWILYLISREVFKPEVKSLADNIRRNFTKKPLSTLHILLPLTSDETKGDALIQASGFIHGAKDYKDDLKLKFYDTVYKNERAEAILKDLLDNWKPYHEPLVVIATMSHTSLFLANQIKNYFRNNKNDKRVKKLKENFTFITTISFASKVPHDPENNIIKITIDSSHEVDFIKDILASSDNNGFSLNERTLLACTSSEYPAGAIGELSRKLSKHSNKIHPFTIIPFSHDGQCKENCCNIDHYKQVILFGYDKNLINMMLFFEKKGYKGKILCATPFSVKDWQELWCEQSSSNLDISYISISTNSYDLAKYNFNNFITDLSECTTNFNPLDVINNFSEDEKRVYSPIDGNYITDFCYEVIRFCAYMKESKKRKFIFSDLSKVINSNKYVKKIPNSTFSETFEETNNGIIPQNDFELKSFNCSEDK